MKRAIRRKPAGRPDPFERDIELALRPGVFIPDRACFSFVSDLEDVAGKLAGLDAGRPTRSVTLYETFLAACYEKASEVDDSSGSFGQFVEGLFCGWIRARQKAGADPDDTARRLLAWMDDDPNGFCHEIEKNAAKAFDKVGLAAFERRVRARFEAAAAPDATTECNPEYARRRWGVTLRTIYAAQRNVDSYVALAEETGLTAQDCHDVANLLVSRRKPEEALSWAERGIDIAGKALHASACDYELVRLKRRLLDKLGRTGEALEDAWAEYRKHPSKYAYDELMQFVPKAERATWHRKAIEAAEGADLSSLIGLLLDTGEMDRLADLVRGNADDVLEQVSHYASEPAAVRLEKGYPDAAARLWRAQGMRIVQAKKSKYYDAALGNFESAWRCYQRAGLAAEWEKTVSRIRAEHHRKYGFMSGFEKLAAGFGPSDEPSFLERARTRWNRNKVDDR